VKRSTTGSSCVADKFILFQDAWDVTKVGEVKPGHSLPGFTQRSSMAEIAIVVAMALRQLLSSWLSCAPALRTRCRNVVHRLWIHSTKILVKFSYLATSIATAANGFNFARSSAL
jgi:hypothetical protein